MKQTILHNLARPMTMRMHVLACLEDEPKSVGEIAAEVSQYMGRTVTKYQITCFLSRAIGEGVAVRLDRGVYIETPDHFCEKNFAQCGWGVA